MQGKERKGVKVIRFGIQGIGLGRRFTALGQGARLFFFVDLGFRLEVELLFSDRWVRL